MKNNYIKMYVILGLVILFSAVFISIRFYNIKVTALNAEKQRIIDEKQKKIVDEYYKLNSDLSVLRASIGDYYDLGNKSYKNLCNSFVNTDKALPYNQYYKDIVAAIGTENFYCHSNDKEFVVSIMLPTGTSSCFDSTWLPYLEEKTSLDESFLCK